MIKTINKPNKSIIKQLIKIVGTDNILTSKEDCIMYATDSTATGNDLYLPDYIVFPSDTSQVQAILRLANENKISVTVRGAGTNMAGACVPFEKGIILATNKMDKILEFDKLNRTIKVQSGTVLGNMQEFVLKEGLFYPPDPSNYKVSTVGGSVAMSSSGARSFKYGGTKDYVIDLTVVLANGEIIKTGSNTVKNATGYNLTQLFVGSEGTLGVVTEVTFKLIPKPQSGNVLLAYFATIDNSAEAINSIVLNNIVPSVMDIMDKTTMQLIEQYKPVGLKTNNDACLFIEVDGDETATNTQIEKIKNICNTHNCTEIVIASSEEEKENLWTARRSSFAAVTAIKPNVLSEDMIVPRSKMPLMIKRTYEIAEQYNINISIVGHAGDGNFHPHIAFDMRDKNELERVNAVVRELFMQAIEYGGKISGEHGIGSVKAKYLKYSVDSVALEYMMKIKKMFDPNNIMNPKKVFDYEVK